MSENTFNFIFIFCFCFYNALVYSVWPNSHTAMAGLGAFVKPLAAMVTHEGSMIVSQGVLSNYFDAMVTIDHSKLGDKCLESEISPIPAMTARCWLCITAGTHC